MIRKRVSFAPDPLAHAKERMWAVAEVRDAESKLLPDGRVHIRVWLWKRSIRTEVYVLRALQDALPADLDPIVDFHV